MASPFQRLGAFLSLQVERWRYFTGRPGFRLETVPSLLRLFYWRMRSLGRGRVLVPLPKWDQKILISADWRGVSKLIFVFRENYEAELMCLERFLSPGQVFVDVGACFGIYTLRASALVGRTGRVLAFEPSSHSFPLLQQTVQTNHISNVSLFREALSDTEGLADLYHHPADVGKSAIGEAQGVSSGVERVRLTTLDSVVRREGLAQIAMLKVDAEGSDELVLRGGASALASFKPTVSFEIYRPGAARLGLTKEGAWNFLYELGYTFFSVTERGGLARLESAPDWGNVVAIHGSSKDVTSKI
jgi:FkbM family methyltransferase